MVLILLSLLWNHYNLILKLQNSYLDEMWLCRDKFKVGSVLRMMNKKVLGQPIYIRPTHI